MRVKPLPQFPVFKSLEEADEALARIAARKRTLAAMEADMNESIDKIKAIVQEDSAPHRAEIAALEAALVKYADYNRGELFDRRKSLELTYGTIGYRASGKLRLLGKHTWERVLRNLRDAGMGSCVRLKEEVDKEALRGLTPEHLKELGCKLVQEDVFFYELAELKLEHAPPY